MVDRNALKGADLIIENKLSFSGNKGKKEVLCSFDDNCEKVTAPELAISAEPKPVAQIISQLQYTS